VKKKIYLHKVYSPL